MIEHYYKEALQRLITDYWSVWIQSEKEELPEWFYTVLNFMEVECHLLFNSVTGVWDEV